jgi:hypothetical protein
MKGIFKKRIWVLLLTVVFIAAACNSSPTAQNNTPNVSGSAVQNQTQPQVQNHVSPEIQQIPTTPIPLSPAPNGTYENKQGNNVPSPYYAPTIPAGASAKCGDGTYSFSQSRRGTCSHHGGVVEWY